jgi:diacylglycerol kinase
MESPFESSESSPRPANRQPKHWRSFSFALAGVRHLFQTQRNARIEAALAVVACAMGWWLNITTTQWALIALTIAMVLIVEALNTAIEAAVDLSTPRIHPLAKTAKDLAAGAVLIAAAASAVVGALIFVPALWERLRR